MWNFTNQMFTLYTYYIFTMTSIQHQQPTMNWNWVKNNTNTLNRLRKWIWEIGFWWMMYNLKERDLVVLCCWETNIVIFVTTACAFATSSCLFRYYFILIFWSLFLFQWLYWLEFEFSKSIIFGCWPKNIYVQWKFN